MKSSLRLVYDKDLFSDRSLYSEEHFIRFQKKNHSESPCIQAHSKYLSVFITGYNSELVPEIITQAPSRYISVFDFSKKIYICVVYIMISDRFMDKSSLHLKTPNNKSNKRK